MISVELRSFIKPDKYKELIEKYNNILHTEKQINYFLNSKEDIRFMKTKRYSEICIKHGNMHDDIKKEKSVKIDSKYNDDMAYILNDLGFIPQIKWYRTRSKANLDVGIGLCLDYTVGYGYIIEVTKNIEDISKSDLTKIELGNFLESLDIDITSKEEFDKKYNEYVLNWEKFTEKVDEINFLK